MNAEVPQAEAQAEPRDPPGLHVHVIVVSLIGGFAADPPNAVISFVEAGDKTPEDAIVVLKDPVLESDALTYTVEMLEGSLPAKGELVSVFIDPFGRPLSPVSVAGMNRRARRRGR